MVDIGFKSEYQILLPSGKCDHCEGVTKRVLTPCASRADKFIRISECLTCHKRTWDWLSTPERAPQAAATYESDFKMFECEECHARVTKLMAYKNKLTCVTCAHLEG